MTRDDDEVKGNESDTARSSEAKPSGPTNRRNRTERHREQKARAPRARTRQEAPPANYELRPTVWIDPMWEPEDMVQEAALTLPVEGYLSWLDSHHRDQPVGMQPSAYENPLSLYLGKAVGVQPRLHTDGHRTWCMLRLTITTRGAEARYLRLALPPWTTPLALEYTAFLTGRTSGHPTQHEVSAFEARNLVRSHASDTAER